jgi:hypothetical protein
MQEIVAKTQAERNNREYKSHFREQSAEENSYPDMWSPQQPRVATIESSLTSSKPTSGPKILLFDSF